MSDHDQGTGDSGAPDFSDAKDKLTSASGADRIILIAGLVFFISSFLPWYGLSFEFLGESIGGNISGWSSGGTAVIAILFGILATAFAVIRVIGMSFKAPMADGMIYLGLGGGAFLFTLLRFVTQTQFTKFGLFVALIAAAALAFGGYQKFGESR